MLGPSTEISINQAYQGKNVQVIGLEHYATDSDADTTKVRSFQQLTPGLNYPICMGTSATRSAYQAFSGTGTADFSIVIDQNGIIQYRGDGVNVSEITDAIDELLVMDIHEPNDVPNRFQLEQNYPNPFNPSTTIRFTLNMAQKITLRIYNSEGRLIRSLIDGNTTSGAYVVKWDGLNKNGQPVSSGVYFYELQGESSHLIRKMTLIR